MTKAENTVAVHTHTIHLVNKIKNNMEINTNSSKTTILLKNVILTI